jgi:putative transposase
MESINGLYKAECIRSTVLHDGPYKTKGNIASHKGRRV